MVLNNAAKSFNMDANRSGSSVLGDILVEVGVISSDQLNQAIAACKGSERDLAKILVDLGFTTEEKIMKGIGIKAKVPYFTSLEGLYTPDSSRLISEELARRLQVVPLFRIENVATVAMVNPLDIFTIDALVKTTGYRIDPVVSMRTTIFETINKLYGGMEGGGFLQTQPGQLAEGVQEGSMIVLDYSSANPSPSSAGPVIRGAPGTISPSAAAMPSTTHSPMSGSPPPGAAIPLSVTGGNASPSARPVDRLGPSRGASPTPGVADIEEAPTIQLVDGIFKQAISKKASDIHIEPGEKQMEIRLRMDGVLRHIMTVPKESEASIVARIKVMGNMDITETRQPQDGRVVSQLNGKPIDLRISTLPTVYGEKVVIRVLDKGNTEFKLANLGFTPANETMFKETLDRPNGIILVTGPTGSGKSTTLYTALTLLNSPERNIITLEDPVEYQLKGLNQVHVNPKVGLTFAKGLRSVLRQDPDVVMVGEIRDQETAEIAIQAALTGHLVLSTLHTNDAPGAITRLINMHVEPFLISASVLMIIAQRLVRVLCVQCREAYQPEEVIIQRLHLTPDPEKPFVFYKPVGCEKCNKTGYKGRVGLYEILRVTSPLRELTVKNANLDQLRHAAREQGMRTLFEEGAALVMNGKTSIDEMMRVCHQDD